VIRKLQLRGVALVAGALAIAGAIAGGGLIPDGVVRADAGPVMYSSIPAALPGNVSSVGFQATQTAEFGDRITFAAGSGNAVGSVTVVLSSWGCESGHWVAADCLTTPGATFNHPITLNLYGAGGTSPGALIATQTESFDIPYRPSTDSVHCTAGRWYSSADSTCYNGLATTITFEFGHPGIVVPSTIVWGIAFNTTTWGYSPIGASACSATAAGCGYDSLNVGAQDLALIGTDTDPSGAFYNSVTAGNYCDGGTGGTGSFRLDDGCWAGFRPLAKFNAPASPTTIVVTGNTSAAENDPGWMFNRDASTSSPYGFTDLVQSIGTGSLQVLPIGSNPADKFIAELFLLQPMADVEDISYDFQLGADDAGLEEQFYMSVYANFGTSSPTKFYDCRYSVIPTFGSTAGFTTVTFDPDLTYPVATRGGTDPSPWPCPASPAAMGPGATLRVISLNVGDSSASDVGVDGYLDNVVVDIAGQRTIYDFEAVSPTDKDQCKKNGWMTFNNPPFIDQGSCVSYVNQLP
jgi:hypothetical protein